MRRFALLLMISCGVSTLGAAELPKLKVSDNKRFLVTADGTPFFYLGDTAWEIFHRLDRAAVDKYLATRARQGFTVIQAVAIAEFDGHTVPNAYGHLPLTDLDPARPAVKDGGQNDYWDHVDYVVDRANANGLYVGFLPTWGRYWHDTVQAGKPLFTKENAEVYGEWLGRRYKDKSLIWILGGDRSVDTAEHKEVIRSMARGLRMGDAGAHLMTFHPRGGEGSAQSFHDDDWLDLNMRQNGHGTEFTGRYDQTKIDYDRRPIKPVIDGEPIYEGHPISFNAKSLGHSIAADVRRPLYWDLFSGACGHTYGHHSIWQFWKPGIEPVNNPLVIWTEAIDQPGANQMVHGRRLIESRPILSRIPDDSVIVTDRVATSVPGAGRYRFAATRDASARYAMVYAPIGRKFSVRMDAIQGEKVKAWWFNPRTGAATAIGEFASKGQREFIPPDPGEQLDWVLVLDDAAQHYPPPGQPVRSQAVLESRELLITTVRTGDTEVATPAAWSPDGQWISFRLTDDRYWSNPATTKKVYADKPADKRPVWVVRPDGSDAHVIESLRFQCAMDGSRAAWKPE